MTPVVLAGRMPTRRARNTTPKKPARASATGMSTRLSPESRLSDVAGCCAAAPRPPLEARGGDASAGWGLTGYSDQSFLTPAGTLPERSGLVRDLSAAPAGAAASNASVKHTRTLLAMRTDRARAAETIKPQRGQ